MSMKLNFDVLERVMDHSESKDLLHIMCTCRTLYKLGVPIFITKIDI